EGICVGIDVSKDTLDVAATSGEKWQFGNDEKGIAEVLAVLLPLKPSLVVTEATGGYQMPLVAVLGPKLPVAVVNPRQVRDFARATGRLAKTDAIDAQ